MCEPSNREKANISAYGEDFYEHVTKGLIYIETSCSGLGLDPDLYEAIPEGCDCTGGCIVRKCPCLKQSNAYSENCLLSILEPANDCSKAAMSTSVRTLDKPVIECNLECSCDSYCCNRLVQNGPRKGLIIKETDKGMGIFTGDFIPKGAFICEYAGELIGIEEARERLALRQELDVSNYILVIRERVANKSTEGVCKPSTSSKGSEVSYKSVTTIVDPTSIGNIGRYANHSCEPNIGLVPVRINSLLPVAALFALREICPGEELCYDYDSVPDRNLDKDQNLVEDKVLRRKCLCKTNRCRGFLPSNKDLF